VLGLLVAAGAAAGVRTHGADPACGPDPHQFWTLSGVGDADKHSETTDPKADPTVQSHDEYRGTLSVRLYVVGTQLAGGTCTGSIVGSGTGDYQSATWHLEGSNGGEGFSCDVPVLAWPSTTQAHGTLQGNRAKVTVSAPDAVERNENYDCGAHFSGFATVSQYLNQSLANVFSKNPNWSFDLSGGSLGTLTYDSDTTSGGREHTEHDTWSFTLSGPQNDPNAGQGPGEPNAPGGAGPNAPAAPCTITGTPKADVLNGTPGRDVICGLGGNDVIRGKGGDDLIYGGPGNDTIDGGAGKDTLLAQSGNDTIRAKDGASDHVDGGPGTDKASTDKRDYVVNVERKG
jgi:Ca2+-binding RTX toxin-like protein